MLHLDSSTCPFALSRFEGFQKSFTRICNGINCYSVAVLGCVWERSLASSRRQVLFQLPFRGEAGTFSGHAGINRFRRRARVAVPDLIVLSMSRVHPVGDEGRDDEDRKDRYPRIGDALYKTVGDGDQQFYGRTRIARDRRNQRRHGGL